MKFFLILLLCTSLLSSSSLSQEKTKTILAIFPHTDDETAVGQVLAKYAKHSKVYIIYVVDDIDTSGLTITPEGDSINHIKISEAKCSCKKLGIEPIFLGLGRLVIDHKKGPRQYFLKTKELKSILAEKIVSLNPNAIITFGPDGESGHFEHRIVSSIVTELILYNKWVDRHSLFYIGFPKEEDIQDQLEGTGEVNKEYLDVAIQFTNADEQKSFESLKCYKNQFKPEHIQEQIAELSADKSNIFYFRRLSVSTKHKKDLFEK